MKKLRKEKHTVFFDFDNTITLGDVFDDLVERFAINDKWRDLEEQWKKRKIGSKACLAGQLKGVRVDKKSLDRYLSGVKVDPYFKKLVKLLKSRKIKTIILSDNFDYILNRILRNHDISHIKVYSNNLRISGKRLVPRFPYINKGCGGCAHCKKTNLLAHMDKGTLAVYVGDGLSDLCASRRADMVFAKGYLKDYLAKRGVEHIPFRGLKDVYDYFRRN